MVTPTIPTSVKFHDFEKYILVNLSNPRSILADVLI